MDNNDKLLPHELRRYHRQIIIPEIDYEGQKKLKKSRVLIIGAGGLGSPLALYLAAAGVGTLGIIDFDVVDETNLQRQILYTSEQVGNSKVSAAKENILDLNPYINVITYEEHFTAENAGKIITKFDIVADGTDNFNARYLVNDASYFHGKPNVFGSVYRFEGRLAFFNYQNGPCYRCIYPTPPTCHVASCAEGGVLGVVPGVIGSLQAVEVIKFILGIGTLAVGKMILFNALDMKFQELKLKKDPNCPLCGPNPEIYEIRESDPTIAISSDRKEEGQSTNANEITVYELKEMMENGEKFILLDARETFEREISTLNPSIQLPPRQYNTIIADMDRDPLYIVYCRVGLRSSRIVDEMIKNGFKRVKSLAGGINKWAQEIDKNIAVY